jgi:ribA/ribD-fused uncharacterized protein
MFEEKILGFGNHRYLSNFYPVEIEFEGKSYASVEHAYQSAKTLDEEQKEFIRKSSSPAVAKKRGKEVNIRHDWDDVKISVMRELLMLKFNQPYFSERLIGTGDAYIEETNWWGDTFWGVCKGKGRNVLGNLLMEIRDNLMKGSNNEKNN